MNIIRDFATIARDPRKLGRISIREANLHWTRPVYLYWVLDAFVINVRKGRQNLLPKLIIPKRREASGNEKTY